ncbi:MAG: site-specific DNA-methyltransferase [Bacteroidetes bacterium]|nr:site-specific DNA-methyltransferase [Bacteroidota bacterium]
MKIINDDCMNGLDTMEAQSVDLLITDPPYSTPVITAFGRKKFKNLADLSIQEFYFTEMKKKLERVLKPDAPVFFFCDDKFYPILFSAFYDWQNMGLMIWDKNKIGMGKPVRKRHELIFYANQGFRDFKKHGEFTHLPSVLNFKHDKDKIHGAQKPVELIKMLIQGFTNENDVVVDLFGGSGSTGIACDETNRNGICFELNNEISIASKERGEKRKEKDLTAGTLFETPN